MLMGTDDAHLKSWVQRDTACMYVWIHVCVYTHTIEQVLEDLGNPGDKSRG